MITTSSTDKQNKAKGPGATGAGKDKEMTKTEAKDKAKDILEEAIAIAYYKLEDEGLDEEECELVLQYINKFGKSACKAFGREYFTL